MKPTTKKLIQRFKRSKQLTSRSESLAMFRRAKKTMGAKKAWAHQFD